MTDKELRKMSRAELLELLIEQMEENERLRLKLDKALNLLKNRQIKLQRAGSIAKAALELNRVFEAADAAAKQYVESVCRLVDDKVDNAEERKRENAAGKQKATKDP